jgi:hypothetical protein
LNELATPLPVIANVSRVVSKVVDRITSDRSDYPLLVAAATVEALKAHSVGARIMYGPAAWVEVMADNSLVWAGCWGGHFHFWVATDWGEIVDINVSVAHRKAAHANPTIRALYSPPMLWSKEVPQFYRYIPEGMAELELTESRDKERYEVVLKELREKCTPAAVAGQTDESDLEFANEPILCPGRRILDDSQGTFKLFDRALGVRGIPKAPI